MISEVDRKRVTIHPVLLYVLCYYTSCVAVISGLFLPAIKDRIRIRHYTSGLNNEYVRLVVKNVLLFCYVHPEDWQTQPCCLFPACQFFNNFLIFFPQLWTDQFSHVASMYQRARCTIFQHLCRNKMLRWQRCQN